MYDDNVGFIPGVIKTLHFVSVLVTHHLANLTTFCTLGSTQFPSSFAVLNLESLANLSSPYLGLGLEVYVLPTTDFFGSEFDVCVLLATVFFGSEFDTICL